MFTPTVLHVPSEPQTPLSDVADRLLNVQTDIWRLELEQARIRGLLRIRRAVRQQLGKQVRELQPAASPAW